MTHIDETPLSCPALADDAVFAAIEDIHGGQAEVPHWILDNDHTAPTDLPQRLPERGHEAAGHRDRMLLQQAAPEQWAPFASACKLVSARTAPEWAGFILACHGMPPVIGDWLAARVDRPGWIHAPRREGGRPGGSIVTTRSLFHGADGWAWLGVDAPVPGVLAPCLNDDQRLVATLPTAAAGRGARHLLGDFEQPSPGRDTDPCRRRAEPGFEGVCRRDLFTRPPRQAADRARSA